MAPFQLFSVCPLLLFSTMTKLISRPNNACLPLNECKGCPLGIMIMITMMMTMLMMMLRQGWPDWWGLVGRQSSYLLLPGHLLLYHQPPPILGHFASVRVWKMEFTPTLPMLVFVYIYVAFGVNAKLSPAFEVTLTWIGLNLCKRLQKVQRDWNESRDLVPCCPGPSVAIYTGSAASH